LEGESGNLSEVTYGFSPGTPAITVSIDFSFRLPCSFSNQAVLGSYVVQGVKNVFTYFLLINSLSPNANGSWHKVLSNIHSFNATLCDVFTR